MALYDIYFAGEIVKGAELAKVKPQVGKLFKVNAAQLEKLFSGKPVRIKAGIDEDTASKYRAALRKVGAVIEIREKAEAKAQPAPKPNRATFQTDDSPPPQAKPAQATPSAPSAPGGLEAISEYGELEELPESRAHSVAAPSGTLDLDVLPPRTGSLEEFAEEEVPLPLPDIDDIPLGDTGEILDQTPPPPPADIDTSELSAAPANSGSLEDCAIEETPLPIPDTSRLEVVD
jgi:hypothetical protein